MELMIKMSAAEADEAMAKGLVQALVYPFSCREEVRRMAAQKAAEKPEKVEKVEPKEAPKAEPKEPEKPKEEPTEPTEPKEEQTEEEKLDRTDIRKLLTKMKQNGQRDDMKQLFLDFGIKSLTELKAENYSDFYSKAQEVIKNA